jgi:hypothetical protein
VEENDAIAATVTASDTCIVAVLSLGATRPPEIEWPGRDRAVVSVGARGATYEVAIGADGAAQVTERVFR